MATQLERRPRRPDAAIDSLLARLRRRIRAYVWADGLAAAVVVLGASFWLSLAIDWTFEPPQPVRIALLALVGVVLALGCRAADASSGCWCGSPIENMALLVERRFGQFHDSLLTAVELAESPTSRRLQSRRCSPTPAATRWRARPKSTWLASSTSARWCGASALALALAVATVVFAAALPRCLGRTGSAATWLMSDELWPRKTHLLVDGFDTQQARRQDRPRLATGPLSVKADAAAGREIPEIVEVRYTTADGCAAATT